MKKVKLFFYLLLLLAVFTGCTANYNGFAFGTDFNVSANLSSKEFKEIQDDLAFLENILSTSVVGSDIHKINDSVITPIVCNPITYELIKLAFEMYDETDKTFNPSIFPLVRLWRFDPENFRYDISSLPSDDDISKTLALCDPNNFILNDNDLSVAKKIPEAKLDLGGIAKGYAVDYCFEKLKNRKDFLINIGGTIRTDAKKKLGIKNPRYEGLLGAVTIVNKAVSTSGDYQRFFKIGSQRYHHILNLDGYPSSTDGIISVTVIGESAAVCDAYSTACMVLGIEKSRKLLADVNYSAIIVTEENYTVIGDVDFEIYDQRFVRLD